MSNIFRTHQRKIIGVAVAAGALTFFNPFRTPAVSAIEDRYSSGGASRNHTPGAATPRGKIDQVHGNQEKHAGIGTPEWDEKIGGQKPNEKPSAFDKTWNKTNYGSDKGK
ncbi:hypothetical protein G7Y79_00028g061890 [Physcia stellaris]|nr:hypothetical protein G7Y79_00028g061890 [Physcia stellaris]